MMKKRFICLCTALVMTFTAVSAAAEEGELTPVTLYETDFSEGVNDKEPWVGGDTWDCTYVDTFKLTYQVTSTLNRLRFSTHTAPNSAAFPMVISNVSLNGDFEYQCMAVTAALKSVAYVIFGYQDKDNFYAVSFEGNDSNKLLGLYRMNAGTLTLVQKSEAQVPGNVTESATSLNDNFVIKYNSGKITISGRTSTYFQDLELDGFIGGKVGFGEAGSTVTFDDIKIIKYEEAVTEDLGRVEPDLTAAEAVGSTKPTISVVSADSLSVTGPASGTGICLLNNIEATSAYKYSADIQIRSLPGGGSGAGLLFNYTDDKNYLYLPIFNNSANTAFVAQLRGMVSTGQTTPHTVTLKNASQTEASYHMSVTAADNGVIFFELTDKNTNETSFYERIMPQASYKDNTPYHAGKFGFAALKGAEVTFSNVVIEEKPVMVVRGMIEKNGNDRTAVGKIYSRTELTNGVMLVGAYSPNTKDVKGVGISAGTKQTSVAGKDVTDAAPGTYDYLAEYTMQEVPANELSRLFFWNSTAELRPLTETVDIP
ncbi:MAG: hypothetical protein ACI4DY_06600 [Monoglobaceae bacterium]